MIRMYLSCPRIESQLQLHPERTVISHVFIARIWGPGVAFGVLGDVSGTLFASLGTLGSSYASSIEVKCRFRDNIEMKGKGKAEMGWQRWDASELTYV